MMIDMQETKVSQFKELAGILQEVSEGMAQSLPISCKAGSKRYEYVLENLKFLMKHAKSKKNGKVLVWGKAEAYRLNRDNVWNKNISYLTNLKSLVSPEWVVKFIPYSDKFGHEDCKIIINSLNGQYSYTIGNGRSYEAINRVISIFKKA